MTQFIKLADGTIINVANVFRVYPGTTKNYGTEDRPKWKRHTRINDWVINDPTGKIYAWFAERSVEVGGE